MFPTGSISAGSQAIGPACLAPGNRGENAAADLPKDVADAAAQDARALWARWSECRDVVAREGLIHHYLPYARMVAATAYTRRTHSEVEFEDYLQLARVALLEAVDRFDPDQGVRFETFAYRRLRGAVLDGLTRLTEKNQQIEARKRLRQERLKDVKDAADETVNGFAGNGFTADVEDLVLAAVSPPSRSPEAHFSYLAEVGIGIALGYLLEDTGMVDVEAFGLGGRVVPAPEVSYFRKTEIRQLRTLLRGLINRLAEQQRTVILYHYLQEIPFDRIALDMGCTRARISQLHRQALRQLRDFLSNDARCDISL